MAAFFIGFTALSANPPTVGDLKEEQRQIGNAYLGDATFYIKQARERLGGGNGKLAQQSGLWALEQLGYAKRRLERHAPRIEEARNGVTGFRSGESTRKDLRKSYSAVRDRYAEVEEQLETLGARLTEMGFPLVSQTLEKLRSASGEDAAKVVADAMRSIGQGGKGDALSGMEGAGANVAPTPTVDSTPPAIINTPSKPSIPGVNASDIQVGPNGEITIKGYKIDPAVVGTPDFGSSQTNASGVTFIQTSKGVLVIPPGTLIAGAKLNADGTVTFADGSRANINDIKVGPDGRIQVRTTDGKQMILNPQTGALTPADGGNSGRNYSGGLPSGARLVDGNGNPITVDGDAPPFEKGKRSFTRKIYLGAPNTLLQREVKVNQQLLEAGDKVFKVEESLGESRNWSLSITLGDTKPDNGKLTATLKVVDSSGNTGVSVSNVTVSSDAGQHASVAPGTAGVYTVTFSQDGDYTAAAEGKTDWGSPFRIEAAFPISVK
ncbi:MAG: hypothetical protein RIQ79_1817 [Verrucomicrobiota bacterium]